MATKAAKRPKAPKKQRKELTIMIRVTIEQKAALVEEAKRFGQGLSSWLLSTGLKEVERAALERARAESGGSA